MKRTKRVRPDLPTQAMPTPEELRDLILDRYHASAARLERLMTNLAPLQSLLVTETFAALAVSPAYEHATGDQRVLLAGAACARAGLLFGLLLTEEHHAETPASGAGGV